MVSSVHMLSVKELYKTCFFLSQFVNFYTLLIGSSIIRVIVAICPH